MFGVIYSLLFLVWVFGEPLARATSMPGLASLMWLLPPTLFLTGIGLLYAVCLPFLYAVMGFIFGAIITALYNLIAGWTGGIQMDLVSATGKEEM